MNFKKLLSSVSKKKWIQLCISAFLLTFSYCIVQFSQINADFTTKYYSFGFYKYYATFLSKLNSLVGFSLAEVLIIFAIILTCVYIVFLIYTLIKRKNQLISAILVPILPVSIVIFMFTISFLPNYHRHTFYEYSGLVMEETSVDNLYDLCQELAQNANIFREAVEQNGEVFDYTTVVSTEQLFEICTNSYENLIFDYPEYENLFEVVQNARAKPVFWSEIMSYLKIKGFFFALTGEANVNTHTSDIYIPSTVCHELAHVAGFMREDEANFISFLVCRSSEDALLNYSGTMLALVHSVNALYSKSSDKYFEIMSILSSDVILDLDAHNIYYNAHDTNIGEISTAVNDTYLKANKQDDGVDSYGRMVDLLIADYNKRNN